MSVRSSLSLSTVSLGLLCHFLSHLGHHICHFFPPEGLSSLHHNSSFSSSQPNDLFFLAVFPDPLVWVKSCSMYPGSPKFLPPTTHHIELQFSTFLSAPTYVHKVQDLASFMLTPYCLPSWCLLQSRSSKPIF